MWNKCGNLVFIKPSAKDTVTSSFIQRGSRGCRAMPLIYCFTHRSAIIQVNFIGNHSEQREKIKYYQFYARRGHLTNPSPLDVHPHRPYYLLFRRITDEKVQAIS